MSTKVTAKQILAKLDEMANRGLWPRFDAPLGTFEYHAMRMVAVVERGGDQDWGVAFECVLGDFLDDEDCPSNYGATVSTYVIIPAEPFGRREARLLPLRVQSEREVSSLSIEGVTVEGPAGDVACSDAMIAEYDLRPGMLCGGCDGGATDSNFVLLIRAYLARHPGSLWGDVTPVFGGACDVLVECDAFEHVLGTAVAARDAATAAYAINPSASPTYRSLADALASGDASRFVPGASNLDWRRWATIRDANAR
jgi:hypothetical protein